jgi:hypothetical protein
MEVTMQRPAGHAMLVLAAALVTALAVTSCGSPGGGQQAGQPSASAVLPSGASGAPSSPASAGAPGTGSPGVPSASVPASSPASPAAPATQAAKTSPSPSGGPSLRPPPRPPHGCDASRWLTAPASADRAVRVPPVPVVTDIRMGTHPDCGYDRIVLSLRGQAPGYEIKYVSKPASGQAARAIATRGDRYLLITLHPAQGHRQSGASTISPASAAVNFPVLRGYSVSSDFEGALCIVVIVAKATAFRVGMLTGRLYVDVAG